ncbi:MAG: hypothetical protein AUI45_11805 [Acidobacteria bacterium 13_1_40CM_2_56_11]|nr:MAG: hypothetical protein AUI45_11805 [Acidobacteria bacterium 13_1_40CM_2_56_11]
MFNSSRIAAVVRANLAYIYLALLTAGVLLVHGYHPGIEDAEIYVPGIKRILDPSLYPFGAEFFLNHARLTLFAQTIAASIRLSHLSFDVAVFIWYLGCTFLTLLACWRLSVELFRESCARWAAVTMVAAVFTIPVAGTALYIEDQYLTSRSIVIFTILFATCSALKQQKRWWMFWSVIALCIHPLMAVFGISFTLILWWKHGNSSFDSAPLLMPAVWPFIDLLPASSKAYESALATRPYFFILQWQWYEWLGALAPLVLFLLIARLAETRSQPKLAVLSRALVIYGFFYLVAALVLTIPARFETAARFQPMRSLHLVYIMLFLLGGGILGEYILRRQVWRWIALFLPLCALMFFAQCQLLPATPHIEWPDVAPQNDWIRVFEWIRTNTPADALFAIDPQHMTKDDQHGFRAIAERSRLADAVKDSGAATMFPETTAAVDWLEQLNAQSGWDHFREKDFRNLKSVYGVSWVVLQKPVAIGFPCPYENPTLRVCRID